LKTFLIMSSVNTICYQLQTVKINCHYEEPIVDERKCLLYILQVFFSEMKNAYLETKPAYTALALMCDIGGALGLILGSTLLTVCEFADFLFILTATWIKVRASAGVFER